MSLLSLTDINSRYGTFQALFGVELRVDEGEIVAVIGANGAGKSTMLKTVVGIMRSPTGEVRFAGQPVGHLPVHQRVSLGMSLVPEGRRVFPSLTVRENLLVGGWVKRPGPWTVTKILQLFPLLERRIDHPAGNLSGGEQQALAIGRGLMANPRLLMLDEVSLGLAPIVVRHLYAAIPAIVEAGTTILIVEQDIGQALSVADRVYCFLEGKVALSGRPRELTREQIAAAYFGV
ncbi:MAG: ABC transporter ATP-binding protein [Thermoleophilia bacterium]